MRLWLIAFTLLARVGAAPLTGVTLVIDPGHGDRANPPKVEADPGAQIYFSGRWYRECHYTWDTALRLRQQALLLGAEVHLTLEDSHLLPMEAPERDFAFKPLVNCPFPQTSHQALLARSDLANAVYQSARQHSQVYFFSLHFDSTSAEVAGSNFYYPRGHRPTPFLGVLKAAIRASGLGRIDLDSGQEAGLAKPAAYAVLNHAQNPDSYLLELGNLRAREGVDLKRMSDPKMRQRYAEIVISALRQRPPSLVPLAPPPAPTPQPLPSRPTQWALAGLLLLLLGLILLDRLDSRGRSRGASSRRP